MTRDAEHTPAPQSVVVPVEPTEEMMLAGALVGPDTNNGQFGYDDARTVFVAMLAAAPAPSSLAGGEVSRAVACVGQVANGAQVAEVYGGEWCLDPALEFRAHLRAILAALSPEAPAREGVKYTIRQEYGFGITEHDPALTPRHEAPQHGGLQPGDEVEFRDHPTEPGREVAHITRHEAPACEMCNGRGEVGGPTGQTPESFEYVTEPCPDCGGTGKHEAPAEGAGEVDDAVTEIAVSTIRWAMGRGDDLRDYKEPLDHVLDAALRARSSAPEAREDASPVSWMTTTEIHGWLLPHLKHMISFNTFHDVVVKALRHTHPAAPSADKLREVVEGFVSDLTGGHPKARASRLVISHDALSKRIDQALAALKAGGA